jgi:hypothetical protein
MPHQQKKRLGTGAICSVIKRFLHPSRTIQEKYQNIMTYDRLEGLIALRKEEKTIQNRACASIVFRHADFEGIELYCSERYAIVTEEGSPAAFFEGNAVPDAGNEAGQATAQADDELRGIPVITDDIQENIARLRAEGYGVDDDNEPAPENVPNNNNNTANNNTTYQGWGSQTICHRRSQGHRFENARLSQHPPNNRRMSWFLHFLPVQFLHDVILVETNKNIEGKPVEWPEFLRFIGLLLLMSTVITGYDRRSWFDHTEPSEFGGAPFRLHKYMTRHRFENILSALRYTNQPFPPFQDKFHQIRQLLDAWNNHMAFIFIASWISCLDESMSPWTSRWTCPGWMYVPRKPHPMGNEYHTICCGMSGITYGLELVEGKDHPNQMPAPPHSNLGATCALLLR